MSKESGKDMDGSDGTLGLSHSPPNTVVTPCAPFMRVIGGESPPGTDQSSSAPTLTKWHPQGETVASKMSWIELGTIVPPCPWRTGFRTPGTAKSADAQVPYMK
jgi:hypothetical protein